MSFIYKNNKIVTLYRSELENPRREHEVVCNKPLYRDNRILGISAYTLIINTEPDLFNRIKNICVLFKEFVIVVNSKLIEE